MKGPPVVIGKKNTWHAKDINVIWVVCFIVILCCTRTHTHTHTHPYTHTVFVYFRYFYLFLFCLDEIFMFGLSKMHGFIIYRQPIFWEVAMWINFTFFLFLFFPPFFFPYLSFFLFPLCRSLSLFFFILSVFECFLPIPFFRLPCLAS